MEKTKEGALMEDCAWRTRLSSCLLRAWREELFTDLSIATGDGGVVRVHKVVLAVASPYFRALLNSDLAERQTNVLHLESVSEETLNVVLEYVYSGRALLKEENVTEILGLADYFQIHDLKRLCCVYIKNHLLPYSCLPIYEFAILHQCHDLARFAFEMALKNCSSVLREASFLNLQPSTLASLLQQPILDVASEDELLKALTSWACLKKQDRSASYASLLALIQEDELSPLMRAVFGDALEEIALEGIGARRELSEGGRERGLSEGERESLSEGERERGLSEGEREEEGKVCIREAPCCKRPKMAAARHKREEEMLIVFGGESSGRILSSAECFSMGSTSWRCSIPRMTGMGTGLNVVEGEEVIPPMGQQRTYAAVACKDNVVYLIGGQTSTQFLRSCESYDVASNRWSPFPNLPSPLHAAQAAFLRDTLWVLGGRDGDGNRITNSLLMYDQRQEGWRPMSPMGEGRVHFGVGSLNGCLYAIGGTTSDNFVLSSCEKYDSELDVWVPIASLSCCRAYHGVAVLGDLLYAIGGYDGNHWLSSAERYDPLTDRWTPVSPMMGARSSFGVTVSEGRIYCIGGFGGDCVSNHVTKYNPRTDMWHGVHAMQLRRYGLMAATLKLPIEKLEKLKLPGAGTGTGTPTYRSDAANHNAS